MYKMKLYNAERINDTLDDYGQKTSTTTKYTVLMDINIANQSVLNSPLYSQCKYVGLTKDRIISEGDIIDGKYRVQYINRKGRLTQVFMVDYE